jgi:membrane-bound metal-dependent hydrolase YbcI (DUF457 family)
LEKRAMNGRVHRVVGAVAGVGTVFACRSQEQKPLRVAEFFGAIGGGVAGGMLPDILEPAVSSYHRRFAHSVAAAGGLVHAARHWVPSLRARLDAAADDYYARAANSQNWLEALIFRVIGFLVDVANGFVTAIAAGYASHVVLDAFTPRSIPIVGATHSF